MVSITGVSAHIQRDELEPLYSLPEGTVNAVIITAVHADKLAALATLLTVHVARLAVSVLEPRIVLLSVGKATATAARDASLRKFVREGIESWESGHWGFVRKTRGAL
jgi:hypothetical protein